jgi:1,4-alpha-glucan branching enzyme
MIRLITLATAGHGYLNFLGNEFGHPDWIDFPREGNNWSFEHARRQWNLVDSLNLKYHLLSRFDRDMIKLAKSNSLLDSSNLKLLYEDSTDKVIIFKRANLVFAFNFHPYQSYADYQFEAPPGKYRMILDSDAPKYGGHNRLQPKQTHFTILEESKTQKKHKLSLYLPALSAFVLYK